MCLNIISGNRLHSCFYKRLKSHFSTSSLVRRVENSKQTYDLFENASVKWIKNLHIGNAIVLAGFQLIHILDPKILNVGFFQLKKQFSFLERMDTCIYIPIKKEQTLFIFIGINELRLQL